MVKALSDLRSYARFLRDLPKLIRTPMTLDRAQEIVRARVRDRHRSFLGLVERAVFQNPRSPYRALFRLAGCTFGDLENRVIAVGLEPTLLELRDAGVYVTFEEFKGHAPIVRGGREIPAEPADFDNPFLSRYYRVSTGGSTGSSRQVLMDVEHLTDGLPLQLIGDCFQGFMGRPTALWFDGLPGHGPASVLGRIPSGNVPERWFTPVSRAGARPHWKFRWAERGIRLVARTSGAPFPKPEPLGLDQAHVIAEWARDALARHGRCGVRTMVSRALRVALAARERGIDLTGAIIAGGGEPPTPAKVAAIRASGAELITNYHFTEVGAVGHRCMNPADPNDQHLLLSNLALIQYPRSVPGFADLTVSSFHFTTLLDTAPKLLLNVESDDYGVVEQRPCGCPYEDLGLDVHLLGTHSFRKLTGEGMTMIGSDLIHILEVVLPSRFGGSPLDYQFVEEEDERGFTRVSLIVSPRVQLESEETVIDVLLEALGRAGHAGDLSRAVWSQAGTLRVKRMEPVWTDRGKLMPLHLASRAREASSLEEAGDPV